MANFCFIMNLIIVKSLFENCWIFIWYYCKCSQRDVICPEDTCFQQSRDEKIYYFYFKNFRLGKPTSGNRKSIWGAIDITRKITYKSCLGFSKKRIWIFRGVNIGVWAISVHYDVVEMLRESERELKIQNYYPHSSLILKRIWRFCLT